MFLHDKAFFEKPDTEIQDLINKCKGKDFKNWLKCLTLIFGKDLSDAAKEQLIKFSCCVIHKASYPDPCHMGLRVPAADPPGKKYPQWPEPERNYCYKSKWEWPLNDIACINCCEYQACLEGMKDIGDLKRVLKKLRPGDDPFHREWCRQSCDQGK